MLGFPRKNEHEVTSILLSSYVPCACKAVTSSLKKIASLPSFCDWLNMNQMGAPGVEPEQAAPPPFRTAIGSSAGFSPPVWVFIMNVAFGWGSHRF